MALRPRARLARGAIQRPAMTGTLTVRYRESMPLYHEVGVPKADRRAARASAPSRAHGTLHVDEPSLRRSGRRLRGGPQATAATRHASDVGRSERPVSDERGGPLAGCVSSSSLGLGPGPFCGMLLADLGAEVLRVDRVEASRALDTSRPATNAMYRSKRRARRRPEVADGVDAVPAAHRCEPTRSSKCSGPVSPSDSASVRTSPARATRGLVYGRLTGYGQDGPLAHKAGHDIDYIAIAGALEPLGRAGAPPTPPINVLGDFAGGGMLLAYGIVAALLARERTGRGSGGRRRDGRRRRAHAHTVLRRARVRLLGPARHQHARHRRALLRRRTRRPTARGSPSARSSRSSTPRCSRASASTPRHLPDQHDRDDWPELRERFAAVIRTRTRDDVGGALRGASTRASLPCSPRKKRRPIRTTRPGAPSASSAACRSPRRRHGSRQPRSASPCRPSIPASAPTRCSRAGASRREIDDLVDAGVVV